MKAVIIASLVFFSLRAMSDEVAKSDCSSLSSSTGPKIVTQSAPEAPVVVVKDSVKTEGK